MDRLGVELRRLAFGPWLRAYADRLPRGLYRLLFMAAGRCFATRWFQNLDCYRRPWMSVVRVDGARQSLARRRKNGKRNFSSSSPTRHKRFFHASQSSRNTLLEKSLDLVISQHTLPNSQLVDPAIEVSARSPTMPSNHQTAKLRRRSRDR